VFVCVVVIGVVVIDVVDVVVVMYFPCTYRRTLPPHMDTHGHGFPPALINTVLERLVEGRRYY
jgi:hypothetical protein